MPWSIPVDTKTQNHLRAADPERLVQLLAQLAVTDHWVAQRVDAILLANDPSALTDSLQQRIATIAPEAYVSYEDAAQYATRLEAILDDIGSLLLPRDPQAALRLTAEFIASDAKIFENMDDSGNQAGAVFERAAELFTIAANALAQPLIAQSLLRDLLRRDGYGVRRFLIEPRTENAN